MAIKFVTGNKGKFSEVEAVMGVGNVEMLKRDLVEIQDVDPRMVIRAKLIEVMKSGGEVFGQDGLMVEDTGMYLEGLNGFPGVFVKQMLEALGNEGLAELVLKVGNNRVRVETVIGFLKDVNAEPVFGVGELSGEIVLPRGNNGFGWDPIFRPDGYEQTFGEMEVEVKSALSMRKMAVEDLLRKM